MVRTQHEPLVWSNRNAQVIDAILQPEHEINAKNRLMKLRRCKTKRLLIIFAVVSAIGLIAWLYVEHTMPEFNQYRLVKSFDTFSVDNDTNKMRFILLWNTVFGDKSWGLPDDTNDPSYFRKHLNCSVSNCVLTNERDLLTRIEMYDAIVFHTAQAFPFFNSIPERRSSKQLYVFAVMEPPGETKHILSDETDFYNLSMTYRMDSDILWTYGYFIDKETKMRVLPSEYPNWRSPPNSYNDSNLWNSWAYKTKMAVWFVSRCDTLSRREKLVAEIQKFMQVDVYGECGPKRFVSIYLCTYECVYNYKLLQLKYGFYYTLYKKC